MDTIGTINKLIKNELSATESYHHVLEKIGIPGDQLVAQSLAPIYSDHQQAVTSLEAQLQLQGGAPLRSSGAWGNLAKLIVEGANLIGSQAMLKALLEGEKNGVTDYSEALQDPALPSPTRYLIENSLLPSQEAHIRDLDRIMNDMVAH